MTTTASPPPPSFASLPPAITRAIFAFAAGQHEATYQQRHYPSPVAPGLQTFAQVSREWHHLARDVASAATLQRLFVRPDDATYYFSGRSGMLELRRRVLLHRAYVREFAMENFFLSDAPSVLTDVEWVFIFHHMPHLEVLDLMKVPRDDVRRLAVIVQAAGFVCRKLKKLLLPAVPERPDIYYDTQRVVEEHQADTIILVNVVLEAVGSWQAHGAKLSELRLPIQFSAWGADHSQSSIAYVDYLAKTCPDIEHISGYYEVHQRVEQWACSEQWFIDEATWETFCTRCTQLRAFDWVVVPFATRFFEIFGRSQKPQLQTLTLSTPMDWDWQHYYRAWGISDDTKGYGVTAQNAHAVLTACPNLRELVVPLYDFADTPEPEPDYFLDQLSLTGERPHRREKVAASQPMIDPELFGDSFCEALAQSCPHLESLSIYRIIRNYEHLFTIMSFTDTALRALATMPRLVQLEVQSVNVTGAGLFALATGFAHGDWTQQRDFRVVVGDADNMAFYDAIEQFLTLLAEWADGVELPCASQRVVMTVRNGRLIPVEPAWAETYLSRLRQLVDIVQRKHPFMKLCVRMFGYDDSPDAPASFAILLELAFYSAEAEISEEFEWADDTQTERIDEVFVACME